MNKNFLAAVGFGIVAFAASVFAQDNPRSVVTKPRPVEVESEFKPHLGLLVGVSQPEGAGHENTDMGIDFGFQMYIPFSLGAEYIHSRVDTGTESKDRDTLWLKTSYNFGGTIPVINHSYVGLGLGAVIASDRTSAAIAPMVGFDIPVAKFEEGFMSLGANARYAIITDGELDTFSLGGVVKYWF
ncbi:MAG: hypothetical protein H7235_12195 [Bdellovibrionaceae bacterium]|nr:hypothetical protein [Pseudobdellovibrionaceae bacterium]